MEKIRLQYRLSNGSWIDCKNRTDEFFNRCLKIRQNIDGEFKNITEKQAIDILENGKTLRNAPADWYSECRCGNFYDKKMAEREAAQNKIKMVRCDCGCTIPEHSVMSASMGTSCPNCYDDMSG